MTCLTLIRIAILAESRCWGENAVRTLYIGENVVNSATKIIFDEHDFIKLVEEYMGSDAAAYLHELIGDIDEDIRIAYENGASDAWSQQDAETYQEGMDVGFEDGYDRGYKAGYCDGMYARGLNEILEKAHRYDDLCK